MRRLWKRLCGWLGHGRRIVRFSGVWCARCGKCIEPRDPMLRQLIVPVLGPPLWPRLR